MKTKDQADYRKGNAKHHCGNCTMFRSPHSCTLVKGEINKQGLCDYYKERKTQNPFKGMK